MTQTEIEEKIKQAQITTQLLENLIDKLSKKGCTLNFSLGKNIQKNKIKSKEETL